MKGLALKTNARLLAGLLLAGAAAASGEAALTRILDVRELGPDEAALRKPVEVEGQILWIHPRHYGMFIYDDGQGIYVRYIVSGTNTLDHYSVGDLVKVSGNSDAGEFLPKIDAGQIEFVGRKPLPEARVFYSHELHAAMFDCDWVEVRGRIVSIKDSMDDVGIRYFMLQIDSNGVLVDAQIPYSEAEAAMLADLMFQRVRFQAVEGTISNIHRQFSTRIFFVSTAAGFEVIDEVFNLRNIPRRAIHELMRAGSNHRFPVRTQGLVTRISGNDVYLRGERSCMKATIRPGTMVQEGDLVELDGFVWPHPVTPLFLARSVSSQEGGAAPVPVELVVDRVQRDKWNWQKDTSLDQELVRIDVELVDIGKSFTIPSDPASSLEGHTLLCRHGSDLMEAKLPIGVPLDEALKPGARLRLTGICNLTRSDQTPWKLSIGGFWIQLRDPDDIVLLAAAPWWTSKRLAGLLGFAFGVIALALVWVALLRRTVERQTAIIGKQIQRESVLNERQRIARELHDNLEQGLAGMAIQLRGALRLLDLNLEKRKQAIGKARGMAGEDPALCTFFGEALDEVVSDADRNRKALQVVQGMLAHCSEEARTSIMDLRGGLLERMDLPAALEATVEPLARECGARFELAVEGTPVRLKQVAERNLLLIAKEAATNAARHAAPANLRVGIAYGEDRVDLEVRDDGVGFDAAAVSGPGHFGLMGMRERASHLEASVGIESRVGQGTVVKVSIGNLGKWKAVPS